MTMIIEDKNLNNYPTISDILKNANINDQDIIDDIWDSIDNNICFGSDNTITLIEAWYFEKIIFDFMKNVKNSKYMFKAIEKQLTNSLYVRID